MGGERADIPEGEDRKGRERGGSSAGDLAGEGDAETCRGDCEAHGVGGEGV